MTDGVAPATLAHLVADGVVDAQLGGLLGVLLEAGMPFVVAGPPGSGAGGVARALAVAVGRPTDAVVALATDADSDQRGTARRFVASAAEGLPVGATIEADGLEDVFARLEAPPFKATRDELSPIGLVVVLGAGPTTTGAPSRVVAVHWIRPLLRDAHGHVQRLPPAVLATWEPREQGWEHFAWGVMPELASRLGRRTGDLERDAAERATRLASASQGSARLS